MGTRAKIHATIGQEHYASKLSTRGHFLVADEPLENGGADQGPTSTELVLSGLAACTTSTLRMYADKKGWAVERIDISVGMRIEKTDTGQITHLETDVGITGDLSAEQKARMLEIARKCPIHRLLTNPVHISTSLKEDSGHLEGTI